jgi:hypothetical protein
MLLVSRSHGTELRLTTGSNFHDLSLINTVAGEQSRYFEVQGYAIYLSSTINSTTGSSSLEREYYTSTVDASMKRRGKGNVWTLFYLMFPCHRT